ncbi:lysosomal Pro-X carboxypeptidase [Sitodiplosis mosellana]|uniref:lysosomal Pro-X carboxypeptidase n=1 Tax=Sitodiplosis mosellana TaxID=263140 RepID=UPI002444BBE5|nr:lysosomal Pro-X carboxypeptidase [Sitodiplosis mosellana]
MQINQFKWFLLLMGGLLTVNAGEYHYNVSYFEVALDHFSFAKNKTFQLRYLTNDTFSKDDRKSPIFFYAGNEGNIETFAQNTGFMWEIAEEFGASIVFAEHRYYGKSQPFGNSSFDSPEHSGYLTSQQALEDYAQLLVQRVNPKKRPVIVFGGSYGGMLAAWFRMKYPHLVIGAIASSAPIFQFTTECGRFNTIVSNVFTVGQGNCSKNIRQSWDVLKKQGATQDGLNALKAKFKICDSYSFTKLKAFEDYLNDVYGALAMVNYPYSTSFLAPLPPNPVTEYCARINGVYNDDQILDNLHNALQIYTNYTGQTKCLNIESAFDASMSGWEFQACTEMVMPMCTKESKKSIFPPSEWDFKKYSDDCFAKWKVLPKIDMATTAYGENLKYASNIVFSNGLMDPWSGGGVLRAPNDKITIIIIPDTAHHLDLRASNPNDPASVIAARRLEKDAIHKWLEQENYV